MFLFQTFTHLQLNRSNHISKFSLPLFAFSHIPHITNDIYTRNRSYFVFKSLKLKAYDTVLCFSCILEDKSDSTSNKFSKP